VPLCVISGLPSHLRTDTTSAAIHREPRDPQIPKSYRGLILCLSASSVDSLSPTDRHNFGGHPQRTQRPTDPEVLQRPHSVPLCLISGLPSHLLTRHNFGGHPQRTQRPTDPEVLQRPHSVPLCLISGPPSHLLTDTTSAAIHRELRDLQIPRFYEASLCASLRHQWTPLSPTDRHNFGGHPQRTQRLPDRRCYPTTAGDGRWPRPAPVDSRTSSPEPPAWERLVIVSG
jgi:hypothetical protein